MMDWTRICRVEDIPRLGARVVETHAGRIAIFRTRDDRVFALDDRCPHRQGPLSQGIVHGLRITCPLHDWMIDLPTGQAIDPDEGCTATHPVRIEEGTVLLGLVAEQPAYLAAS